MGAQATKCLIVNSHFRPLVGGALTVYEGLATARPDVFQILTARVDYSTGLLCHDAGPYDAAAPFQVHRIDQMRPLLHRPGGPKWAQALIGAAGEWRIRRAVLTEILRLHGAHSFDFICIGALDALGWLVPALKQRTDAGIMLYIHGEEVSQIPYQPRIETARRQALTQADGVIAVSNFTARLLLEKFDLDPDKVKLVQNGVDLRRFKEKPVENVRMPLGIGAGPLVLAVGRLVERKGFDRLLEAWPRVLAAVPEAKLAIAGQGPYESILRGLIEASDMNASVHLLGHVSDNLLPSLYATADIFAMPNRILPDGDTEGFGLVFLEAAASGVPSVGGKAGGVVDAVIDGKTGLLVDGEDTGAIAFAITELLSNDVRRAEMSEAAREHALTQGWPEKIDELLCFFETLLNKNED